MLLRLITVLQTVAVLFRHCTVLAPVDGIEPPLPRSERSVLPLNETGIGQSGWIRTTDPLLPRQVGTTRLPYTLMIWTSRRDSNPHAPRS